MSDDVLGLTAQIVSAHVTKNAVPVEELPALIREVYKTSRLSVRRLRRSKH